MSEPPEIRLLRAFVTLADELHFGRAAARLHVVQAALSQQIKALEESVGAPLFERTTRRVELTEVGRIFRVDALDTLTRADRAFARAQRAARGELGTLRLGFVSAAALTALPRTLLALESTSPGLDVELLEAGTKAQLDGLRSGQLDAGFILGPLEADDLQSMVATEHALQVVLPPGHRLQGRRRVRLADLADEAVVWMKAESEPTLRRAYLEMCRRAGFEPRVAYEVDHLVSMFGLVAAGMGISFVPQNAESLAPAGVDLVALSPRVPSRVLLVWDPEVHSPVVQALLAVAREE